MLFEGLVGSIGSDTALSAQLDDDVSERVKLPDPPGRQLRIHHATQQAGLKVVGGHDRIVGRWNDPPGAATRGMLASYVRDRYAWTAA